MSEEWALYRKKIIGLGENSVHKSYYPDLQEKIDQLEASERNLHTIINNATDAIIIHDSQGHIILLNDQAQRILNIRDEEKDRFTIFDISSPKVDTNDLNRIWSEVLERNPKTFEWIIRPIGSNKNISVEVSLNKSLWYGETVMIAVVRDFTERKKYEKELIIAREMAEESDRLKSSFLANLSHEIRTPMNAILGFTDLLKTPDLTIDEKQSYIDIVHSSGEHLLSIINDILEISRIDAGQAEAHYSIININSFMDDIYNSMRVTIPKEKNIELKINKPSQVLITDIVTDEVKLSQVLINLINNAIKFTDEGYVAFGYEVPSKKQLTFRVKDTGIGIDKNYHKVIFERFRQVDGELAIRKGGSGLGLAISKAYIEMLGGTITLESVPGEGSLFSFTLPILTPKKTRMDLTNKEEDQQIPKGDNEVILVAEDDYLNYLYLEKLITSLNYQLIRALNGKEAVDICSANKNIRLVLMDIKMPVMNGYEAMMMIRKINPTLPIVAQTAYALSEDILRIKQEGFDGHLIKPIRKADLFEVIRKYMSK